MIFTFEKYLKSRDNVICVDANFPAKLQISHWPDHSTPDELFADTSTEMAFKLIESEKKYEYLKGINVVSNNHYDSDGVIAAFVLIDPHFASANKQALINVALTSDFYEFTTEDALKADVVLTNLIDKEKSLFKELIKNEPFPNAAQLIYEKAFQLLPKLIQNIDDYEEQWKDDFEWHQKSENSFANQQSVFSDYGDIKLSVIESDFKIHPVVKVTHAKFDIILSSIRRAEGRMYELTYKPYTWHSTTRQDQVERKSFESLVQNLNQIEMNNNGKWKVLGKDPVSEWNYKLHFSNEKFELIPSKLEVFELENILFDYFFE
ncbi:MAG: DUF6687 family protein [Melioribacteraceae bacterium]|nr:DUF6687 family protein [Melioribacteraceae bacterium]